MPLQKQPKATRKKSTKATAKVVNNRKPNGLGTLFRNKWTAAIIVLVIAVIGAVTLTLSQAASVSGPITGIADKCLDNKAARAVNSNPIQLYDCNNTAAQKWTLPGDGTIRTKGFCLDVTGASKKPQTIVQLYQCNGTAAQKWTIQSNGAIINPNSGLCLDDKYAGTANGNQIWTYTCNGTVAQKWTVPKVATEPPTPPSTVCNPLPVTLPAPSTMRASDKKVFAFYFPPFPVSIDNKAPDADHISRWVNSLNTKDGAYDLRDRPIERSPWARSDWKQADFEVEIKRAIEVGIDGFIWEYHTSASDARWNQLPAMLAAARAVDPGFKIQLSPDFNTKAGATPDSVVADVLKVKDDPNIFRLSDGRIVLSPFYPERQPVAFWNSMRDQLAAKGVKTALVPMFLSWSGSAKEKAEWKDSVYGYTSWGTRSTTGIANYAKNSAEAHARGGIWMQPVAFEDTRSYDGRFWESSNSSVLRQSFEMAINSNADWVVMNTWNDYTESWVSPSKERGYAVTDVASYYINWFKTGKAPQVTQDALYWFHRSQSTDAPFSSQPVGRNGQKVTMYVPNGNPASNDVEMVAFLTSPAKLVIKQGSTVKTMDAGAGVTSFKVPLVAGTTPEFSIERGGATKQTVKSDTPIRTSVPFQDMMYHAGGGITACKRP